MSGQSEFRSLSQSGTRRDAALVEREGETRPEKVSMRVEAGPSAAAAARGALAALGEDVDRDLLNDVRLLVSELVTNSVRHSGSEAERAAVGLDISVATGTLRVEVSDPGAGFEPAPPEADNRQIGGWGLQLVDRLADRWGVLREDQTRVWFEIDFKHASAARSQAAHA